MAIFGAGSVWDGNDEQRESFFANGNYVIGWDHDDAQDVYLSLAYLKAGDIIYLKSNQPGSRTIRVKGIGIVTHPIIQNVFNRVFSANPMPVTEPVIQVRWINTEEFHIVIPDEIGKLTAIRASTIYEEYLPLVQNAIINRLFN